jgi:hypothetical protein
MEEHLRRRHDRPIRKPGPQGNGAKGGVEGLIRAGLVKGPTTCQTLFRNHRSSYFAVNCPRNKEGPSLPSPLLDLSVGMASRDPGHSTTSELQHLIDLQLAESEEGSTSQGDIDVNLISQDIRHRSQWLHITEWPRFLEPHQGRLSEVAALTFLPDSDELYDHGVQGNQDGLLHVILLSLDRVIARARSSLKEGKLNVFDQHRLNSFVARRSSQKPLIHDLKEETYVKYIRVLKRLICYVFRLAWQKAQPTPKFRLTEAQKISMIEAVGAAAELAQSHGEGLALDQRRSLSKRLDDKCLLFLVSLLDHKLYGDIYDSIVVGFLAAMAIRPSATKPSAGVAQKLYSAAEFTPKLSALIKMSQLLVGERALLAVELDEADVPARALEEMQDRFMTKESRSPISWSLKLRAYGKAIQDNTTSLGQIIWSDDNETLTYKNMRFSMTGLRDLLTAEVKAAQDNLAELLLVPPDTERQEIVPTISLRSLMDDPSDGRPGWSFLDHPGNEVLHGYQRWILNRVLKESFLRNDFFENARTAKWRLHAVARYLSTVNAFLERLLLLVHIAGGQPARGTELLCIQYCNARDGSGGRRNIFIENGLVSFVTYYHKGYTITGTTKIIHRYLPSEVRELLVYYIWLVMPFLDQLSKLAKLPGFKRSTTPYLWGEFANLPGTSSLSIKDLIHLGPVAGKKTARKEQKKLSRVIQKSADSDKMTAKTGLRVNGASWPTARLSAVLGKTFGRVLGTEASVQMWRHAAIAISRRHLQQAKFKRDFIEAVSWAWNDEMAAHSTQLAGLTYARGLEEAPRHVAGARAEYRRISREWHAWLGFGGYRA